MSEFQDPKPSPQPKLTGPVPKLPPARPRTLDDLMEHGRFFADFQLRQDGTFPPTCFLLAKQGPVIFQPGPVTDAASKDRMAMLVQLFCVAHAATAVVMVMEAWASFGTPDAPLDPKEMPSETLHRKEIVIVAGESRERVRQQCLPLIRTGSGTYFGLGDDLSPPEGTTMEGRFTQFLPPVPPTARQRRWAKESLQRMGVLVF